jgi:plasmid stability protein
MTRTTLKMGADLLRRLKERAAREGRSMQDLANELLQDGLMRREEPVGYELRLDGWDAREQPGVDLLDRDKLFDLMDGR